ncbi:MAG TPA: hypothetical protein VNL13_07425 [Sulfolobales archaeon]|nr:hypothetical protein [Sulfolobales archaeon]
MIAGVELYEHFTPWNVHHAHSLFHYSEALLLTHNLASLLLPIASGGGDLSLICGARSKDIKGVLAKYCRATWRKQDG